MIAAILAMSDVVKIEESGRAAAGRHASEVIAVEHLAADRSGDHRGHAAELVAVEVADVLGIAGEPRRGRWIDRQRFAGTLDEALLARLHVVTAVWTAGRGTSSHQNDVTVACKAFYNRLARPGFAKFMRQMFARLVEQLSLRMLAPDGHAAVARFDDIVIQDGSSFALKKALCNVFSGRFTTVEPAAVEVHATYSGFSDEVLAVQIASDSEAEAEDVTRCHHRGRVMLTA